MPARRRILGTDDTGHGACAFANDCALAATIADALAVWPLQDGIALMASTEDRLRTLVAENLEVDGQPVNVPADLNVSLTDAGVPSMDFVAFAKVIVREFDVPLTPDECADFSTLKDLAAYIDGQAA